MNLGVFLRKFCEKHSLTYVKIGQILSTRYDLLPKKDCEELQKLLDNTRPLEYETIKDIIENDYNKPIGEIFKRFNKNPLASASIAQVHKAELKNGDVVAVKVRRPGIEKRVRKDIIFLKVLLTMLSAFIPKLRRIRPIKILNQFHRWIVEEMDFRNEVENMVLTRKNYGKYNNHFGKNLGRIHLIRPYKKLCTDNIIISNFIEGTPLIKYKKKDSRGFKSLKTYVVAGMRELFESKVYCIQADPHPANIIIMKNGDVANVDCGLLCKLEGEQLKIIQEMFFQIYLKDKDNLTKNLMFFSKNKSKKLRKSMGNDIEEFLESTDSRGIGFWYIGLAKIMIKNKISIPDGFALFSRVNIMIDGSINTYDKDITALDLFKNEFRAILKKRIIKNLESTDYLPLVYKISERIKKSPENTLEIIDKFINKYFAEK
ncbi:AarF/ABC1/UbiB kinase family protein [Candidatus Woesearchaeota archaeon]|nr:AarF/ABC1/UbiB kinase family protein [Candidatus Woesearchaeota archaeon]